MPNVLEFFFSNIYKFLILESVFRYFGRKNLDKHQVQDYASFGLRELLAHFGSQSSLHDYSSFYEKHLGSLRKTQKNVDILEVGTLKGGGLASWFFYFPTANLVGLDFNPFKIRYKSKRIRHLFADISSKKILNNTSKHLNQQFNLVIDDCSHMLVDQILCFFCLFKQVKSGGYYVVEDLNFPYIGSSHNPTHETVGLKDILKCIELGNPVSSRHVCHQEVADLRDQVDSIHFYQSKNPNDYKIFGVCDVSEIVFVKKK